MLIAEPAHAGREPIDWKSKELLGCIGMVFQEPEHQFAANFVRDEFAIGPIDLGPMATSSRTKLAANWCSGSWKHHADTAQQFLAFPVDRLTPGMRGLEVVGDEHLAGDRLE